MSNYLKRKIMANTKPRVDIPQNPVEELHLAGRIYAKHLSDGNVSLLKALQSNGWDVNGPEIENALALNSEAEDLQRQANLAYAKRNLLLDKIDPSVKATRDLLLGVFRDNPKELSQWGFDVSDSPRAAAKKKE